MYDDTDAQILDFHRSMLVDSARMRAYARAVMGAVRPGDVVLDIGCGTGVLSYFACMAGARRVYAVEQSPVIELAKDLGKRNGFDDRVVYLNEWSTEVELPEPADVLITETIGNAAVDEGILGSVIDARERLLRPGGTIVPEQLQLWTAGMESWDDHALVDDWARPVFTLDCGAAHDRAKGTLWWVDLDAKHVVTDPALVATIDLATVDDATITAAGTVTARRRGTAHGLACWFEADLGHGITVSNAPPASAPSWSQAFLPADQVLGLAQGDALAWDLAVSANGQGWRWSLGHADPNLLSTGQDVDADDDDAAAGADGGAIHRRASRGEVDLMILQLMDGEHSDVEIAAAVFERHARHFVDERTMRNHVLSVIEDYQRIERVDRHAVVTGGC